MNKLLAVISEVMAENGINYQYGDYRGKVRYPYVVGEYNETYFAFEDNHSSGYLTLHAWGRGEGARLQLTQLADTIKAAFDDLQVVRDGECFHVFYNTMQWIPTGDDDLDRIDVSLLTNIWKG